MAFAYKEEMAKFHLLFQETEEDDEKVVDVDDFNDMGSCSEHNTDSEEEEEFVVSKNVKCNGMYLGMDNKTTWKKCKVERNVHVEGVPTTDLSPSGPKGDALNVTDPTSSWKIFFDEDMIEKIVERTNMYIEKATVNFARERDCKKTDSREIYAVIGLLYLGGLFKTSHMNVRDLWATNGTGIGIFHSTMTYKRFLLLLRYICFDNINSTDEREAVDNLAQVRELFDTFIAKCQESYTVGRYLTLDEKLEPYRGRCSFRQYMPKKRFRYGIKVYTVVDSCTFYTWNMEIYAGQQPDGPFKTSYSPDDIAKRLLKPLFKSGHKNVTTSNRFTSYSLAKDLLAEGITLVGLMKKTKKEIPREFIASRRRDIYSTIFGYRDDATLLSYSPKKRKCVVLLSTMENNDDVTTSDGKRPPDIIDFHDATKGAVCASEEMAACYTTCRITNRWPMVVFFSMLNTAAINARVILLSTNDPPLQFKSRREFLKNLGLSLVADLVRFRSSSETLPRNLRMECAELCGEPPSKKIAIKSKGRCSLCPRSKDKKTKVVCFYCMRLICGSHQRPVCQNCAESGVM